MKKLRSKVFWVIFSLLTAFTLLIFITSTTRGYLEKRNSVSDILINVSRMDRRKSELEFSNREVPEQDIRRIYLNFTIYTVVLDDDGNYMEVINNTNNDDIDEEYIAKVANNMINNHKSNIYIGNLYTSRYSYIFSNDNTLVIMDNMNTNAILISQFITNSLIFVLCEIIIFVIAYLITKWITSPVQESFEKQKTFIADASHELKTPLAVMIASADAYFTDKNDKWVYNMKSESERMTKLVTELLDLAKSEKEQDLVMEKNDLSDIIMGSILTFESLFYDNDIKLKYDIEPDIKLLCNEDSIVQLMTILLDNAIKHCSEKGKILVNLFKKNKQIILEVKNSGLPIKKEDEEKIFERFYKVDTSRNRNSNNYGLGLAIAKNIVEKHEGNISAHSSNGYTTFKVIWNQK